MRQFLAVRWALAWQMSCWLVLGSVARGEDRAALASWNQGPARLRIESFVAEVTDSAGPKFVRPADRVACFDNDGTLWCEQPNYVQATFVLDRIRALAPEHPEWNQTQPFKAALKGDKVTLGFQGKSGFLSLLIATQADITPEAYGKSVRDWLDTARHPRFKRRYTECIYQPMVELVAFLQQHDFKVFIVTGGGIDFVREFSEEAYGIPRENVIGTSLDYVVGRTDVKLTLIGKGSAPVINDGDGKALNIQLHIGRRPILVAGNADGDLSMLQYSASGTTPFLNLIVHHDDAEREYAYDRASAVGQLDKALDEALARDWTVLSVKKDFRSVFPSRD